MTIIRTIIIMNVFLISNIILLLLLSALSLFQYLRFSISIILDWILFLNYPNLFSIKNVIVAIQS
jgi:hypothetical protein